MNHDSATTTIWRLYDAAIRHNKIFIFSTARHDYFEHSKTFVVRYGGIKSQYYATRITTIEQESQDANMN